MADHWPHITAEQIGPALHLDADHWDQMLTVQDLFRTSDDILKNPQVFFSLFQDFKAFALAFFEFLTRQHPDPDSSDDKCFSLLNDMDCELPSLDGMLSGHEMQVVHEVMCSPLLDPAFHAADFSSDGECSIISLDSYHSLREEISLPEVSPALATLLPLELPVLELPLLLEGSDLSNISVTPPPIKLEHLQVPDECQARAYHLSCHLLAFRRVPDATLPGFLACTPTPAMG